jgi:hypothetical protein
MYFGMFMEKTGRGAGFLAVVFFLTLIPSQLSEHLPFSSLSLPSLCIGTADLCETGGGLIAKYIEEAVSVAFIQYLKGV